MPGYDPLDEFIRAFKLLVTGDDLDPLLAFVCRIGREVQEQVEDDLWP